MHPQHQLAIIFGSVTKKELIHLAAWRDLGHVTSPTFQYIEAYYNRKRIQRQLGSEPCPVQLANMLALVALY
jgi:hypothetical protein